jgi:hypothetical protein
MGGLLVLAAWVAPARAAEPSAEDLQSRLTQSRARLNALYEEASQRAVQFERARAAVSDAERALARERRAVRQAKSESAAQSAAVADLTVQQLQTQSGMERYSSLLSGGDPRDILARAGAYESTAQAMAAKIDELAARQAVHEAARERMATALQEQRAAFERESAARSQVNAALAESKRQTKDAAAEHAALARQLAQRSIEVPQPIEQPSEPASKLPKPAKPTPSPSAAPPSGAPVVTPPVPSGDAPAEPYGVWDKIAKCESGGNWHINTGNGYYGGLQFSARTWRSVGGPGLPHEHSREVQIKYAKILQARSGWGQWSCSWARFT